MAISLQSGTPLAEALSSSVQPKLVEMGWSVDGEDSSPLSEYIVLMLVNGKTEDQINAELSGDLLGLGSEDESTKVFTRWLFDELKRLAEQHGVASSASAQAGGNLVVRSEINGLPNQGDDDMQDAGGQGLETIPTGPRAMRHGGSNANSNNNSNNNNNNQQHGQQRGRRPGAIFNQMNKAMERSPNDALRHVRNQGNSPRITKYDRNGRPIMGGNSGMNQHNRNMQNQRMHQHVQNAFGVPPQMGGPQQQQQQQMQNQNMAAAAAAGAFNPLMMTPDQQMQFFQMMEQQARMLGMPGFAPGMMGGQQGFPSGQGGQFGQNGGQGSGRSMFERVQGPGNQHHKNNNGSAAQSESADAMDAESKTDADGEETSKDQVACKFALGCTKVECPFAHPSPVSDPSRGTSFVPGEKCEFGVNCKNRKCTQSHPSPAGAPNAPAAGGTAPKINAAAQLDCKYYPNCTNPMCPYKHPMPPCRNGPSCTRPGCHFSHEPLEIPCRFHPCLNASCVYKHEEGQQGNFDHKVWTSDGKAKPHVSERKFVNDDNSQGEELIIPGQESSQGNGDQDLLNVEHDMHDL